MSIEQSIYCRVLGEGEPLVLLHGWGVNSVVWEPVIEQLSRHFYLHIIDLPGFGQSQTISSYTLTEMVDAIIAQVPEQASWCGWSLGGLIATHASYLYPEKIKSLIQVCSSVKFVGESAWPGVEGGIFDDFMHDLQVNTDKTLSRFISIQAMGSATARKDINVLKKLLATTKKSDQQALLAGLQLLKNTDLRQQFTRISIPCLSIFGQFDSLLPLSAQQQMHKLLPQSSQQVFEKSAHAPFVSESGKFAETIINFLSD